LYTVFGVVWQRDRVLQEPTRSRITGCEETLVPRLISKSNKPPLTIKREFQFRASHNKIRNQIFDKKLPTRFGHKRNIAAIRIFLSTVLAADIY
jgi:hypothetical protein